MLLGKRIVTERLLDRRFHELDSFVPRLVAGLRSDFQGILRAATD